MLKKMELDIADLGLVRRHWNQPGGCQFSKSHQYKLSEEIMGFKVYLFS